MASLSFESCCGSPGCGSRLCRLDEQREERKEHERFYQRKSQQQHREYASARRRVSRCAFARCGYRAPVADPTAPYGFAYSERLRLSESDSVTPLAFPDVSIAVADLLP